MCLFFTYKNYNKNKNISLTGNKFIVYFCKCSIFKEYSSARFGLLTDCIASPSTFIHPSKLVLLALCVETRKSEYRIASCNLTRTSCQKG